MPRRSHHCSHLHLEIISKTKRKALVQSCDMIIDRHTSAFAVVSRTPFGNIQGMLYNVQEGTEICSCSELLVFQGFSAAWLYDVLKIHACMKLQVVGSIYMGATTFFRLSK